MARWLRGGSHVALVLAYGPLNKNIKKKSHMGERSSSADTYSYTYFGKSICLNGINSNNNMSRS